MKNQQKGFINFILAGVLLIVVGVVGGYFLLAKKSVPVAEEQNIPSAENSEAEIMANLKTNWQSVQASFTFRPGHPGTVDWGSPVAVQFIGNNNLFIVYEDGYIANTALLNYKDGKFTVSESFPNHGLFTLAEWQNLVNRYGDPSYAVVSYSINSIRGGEIISYESLTKVPENVFVKNYPVVPQ